MLVGMSGGVDSSVAAALLVQEGYEVIGVTLNVWPEREGLPLVERENGCCALGAVEDARRVADVLGIPYYVLNFRELFQQRVIANFVGEYLRGRTPNPCVRCNQFVKFDALLHRARALGADYVATGHYGRVEWDEGRGRWVLRKAVDRKKDQSYVLYVMSQDRLARALMPVGHLTKEETRRIAADLGLPVAHKPESQEICFVPGRSYGDYLATVAPESLRPGPIVDRAGRVLGEHRGVAFYTIGQRRGLGIVAGKPLYVVDILADENTVVVGGEEDLYHDECLATDVNFVAVERLDGPMRVRAKVRYRAEEADAVIAPHPSGHVHVRFDAPQRAVTPGQAIVFYQDDLVIGGGVIEDVPSKAGAVEESLVGAARGGDP